MVSDRFYWIHHKVKMKGHHRQLAKKSQRFYWSHHKVKEKGQQGQLAKKSQRFQKGFTKVIIRSKRRSPWTISKDVSMVSERFYWSHHKVKKKGYHGQLAKKSQWFQKGYNEVIIRSKRRSPWTISKDVSMVSERLYWSHHKVKKKGHQGQLAKKSQRFQKGFTEVITRSKIKVIMDY